jgi:hypothetical protein
MTHHNQTKELTTWFLIGSTKKPALLISMCTVQIKHNVIRPLDTPTTEYPTYATIPVLCTSSPTLIMILITVYHTAPATYMPRDKQT